MWTSMIFVWLIYLLFMFEMHKVRRDLRDANRENEELVEQNEVHLAIAIAQEDRIQTLASHRPRVVTLFRN